jgi:hypothetical protein
MAAPAEANVHEHIARVMYYFSVHLLFASIVASAAWVLTSILRASATTKYWIHRIQFRSAFRSTHR